MFSFLIDVFISFKGTDFRNFCSYSVFPFNVLKNISAKKIIHLLQNVNIFHFKLKPPCQQCYFKSLLICHDMFSLFLRFSKLYFEVGTCSKLKQCAICCSMTEWRRERDPGINITKRRALTATFSLFISKQRGLTCQMAACPQSHTRSHS